MEIVVSRSLIVMISLQGLEVVTYHRMMPFPPTFRLQNTWQVLLVSVIVHYVPSVRLTTNILMILFNLPK